MISVIVPVYNVEDYLHYAMESLEHQTYKYMEVLLIDDGSSDGSGQLCDQYAQQYDWVTSYHKVNGGLSDARNYGVLKAKGDWITFLDPDDYLEPCALELLAELQDRTQADMVSGKVEPTAHYHRYQNFHLDQLDLDQVKVYDKAKALTEMLYGDLVTVSACGKLYRKELLEKAPFPKGRIYEDLYVISEQLNQVQSVALYHLPIYHYYHRPGSITASAFTPKQYEFYEAIDHLKEVVNATYPESSELQEAIISRFFTGSLLIFTMIKDGDSVEFKRLQEETRPYLPLVLKNARVSKKRRILYVLITKYPRLYYQFKKLKKS